MYNFLSLPGISPAVNYISHCKIKAGYGQQDMQQVHESEGNQWEKKSKELLEKMWERLWCVGLLVCWIVGCGFIHRGLIRCGFIGCESLVEVEACCGCASDDANQCPGKYMGKKRGGSKSQFPYSLPTTKF